MTQPKLQFWYDLASTYSYLSAVRIEAMAAKAGIDLDWRPFLLGPIFQAQGWSTSPFKLYPAKGRYMIRDMERLSAERGLVFHMPRVFPVHSVMAARLAIAGQTEGCIAQLTTALFRAQFQTGADIADPNVLEQIVSSLGLDFARFFAAIATPDVKQKLRAQTIEATRIGIFGAPTFVTPDGEHFWGDDRLDQALAWTRAL